MKNVPKAFSFKTWIFYCLLCISLVLLSACGSGGGGDDGGGGSDTTSGMGSVSFRLIFEEPASNFPSGLLAGKSPSGDICVDYGIKTISAEVFNSSNIPVADGSWDCSDRRGTIEDVPAGDNISVLVDGIVDGGGNEWEGEIGDISVSPGKITNAGEVNMKYNGDDKTPPKVDSTDPPDGDTDFPIDADITCKFSEDMVPASVDEVTFTLESDTTTTAVEGTVTYDLMTLSATFDPTDDLSYCTNYTATVASGVEDRAGLNMTEDFSWHFTTFGDDTNPDNKWYKDSDSDRYSDGTEIISCEKPGDDYFLAEDLKSTSGDCDDNDDSINPGVQEVCDGTDNDCNPNTTDGSSEDWFGAECDGSDSDLCNEGTFTCTGGKQRCSDTTSDNIEVCDGQDNDCDGSVDENLTRGTSCGVGECAGNTGIETCTDGKWGNDTCNPISGAKAEVCDDRDNDCDGKVDENLTRGTSCGVGECAGNTGTETCSDGKWGNDTCDPRSGAKAEVCDDRDNDCDGRADENLTRGTTCGVGECAGNTGTETCSDGKWGNDTCDPRSGAKAEVCDDRDNDCDGRADENLTRGTTCGVGECANNTGIETCTDGQWGGDTCNPLFGARAEVCDNKDNDCDDSTDEGLTSETTCGEGACEGNTGVTSCINGKFVDDCDPFSGATDEVCNDIDDDCDGDTDEDISCEYLLGITDDDRLVTFDPYSGNVIYDHGKLSNIFTFNSGLAYDSQTESLYTLDLGPRKLYWIDPRTIESGRVDQLILGVSLKDYWFEAGLSYHPRWDSLFTTMTKTTYYDGTETTSAEVVLIDQYEATVTAVGSIYGGWLCDSLIYNDQKDRIYGLCQKNWNEDIFLAELTPHTGEFTEVIGYDVATLLNTKSNSLFGLTRKPGTDIYFSVKYQEVCEEILSDYPICDGLYEYVIIDLDKNDIKILANSSEVDVTSSAIIYKDFDVGFK